MSVLYEMNETGEVGASGTCETTRRIEPVRERLLGLVRQSDKWDRQVRGLWVL